MQSSITECNAMLEARNTLADGKVLQIKTGASGDIDSGVTGTVLEEFTLNSPAFNVAASRVASMDLPAAITATSTGTGSPYHYVILDGGTVLRSGDVGVDMAISQDTWAPGDSLEIVAYTTTQPK